MRVLWSGSGLAFPGDAAPLRMGFIGSTDVHAATPGYVDERTWSGSALVGAGFEGAVRSNAWSAGGLVGVWAEENTREAIFDALYRREVYATSGPRISLRFGLATQTKNMCEADEWHLRSIWAVFPHSLSSPLSSVQVQADTTPLSEIEIIKLTRVDGETKEQVIKVWKAEWR